MTEQAADFEDFVRAVEPRLHDALVATYGVVDGRVLTVDALSWAWEHWHRAQALMSPVAYLYRVGQSAARRLAMRTAPTAYRPAAATSDALPFAADLATAIQRLPEQQRRAVMLVHGFGWTVRDVAELLDIAPSTVQQALTRGTRRLAELMEPSDVR